MTPGHETLLTYDGVAVPELCARAGATHVVALERCGSTMDVAHEQAAAGAPHGTVIVAEQQEAGRGRTGKSWVSPAGAGVWASVLLRPGSAGQGGVLSLRVGLELAERLDAFASSPVQLKWPNDLFVEGRKLAGILTEARWRGDQTDWIVVGVGVNVRLPAPDVAAASLGATASCAEVLVAVVQAVLSAGVAPSALSDDEMRRYAERDLTVDRDIVAPLVGTVLGITRGGGLRVHSGVGEAVAVAGSLVFRFSDGAV